jgi:hypothetical protein
MGTDVSCRGDGGDGFNGGRGIGRFVARPEDSHCGGCGCGSQSALGFRAWARFSFL